MCQLTQKISFKTSNVLNINQCLCLTVFQQRRSETNQRPQAGCLLASNFPIFYPSTFFLVKHTFFVVTSLSLPIRRAPNRKINSSFRRLHSRPGAAASFAMPLRFSILKDILYQAKVSDHDITVFIM